MRWGRRRRKGARGSISQRCSCECHGNKYLKYSSDVNAVATIEKVISSDIAKRCIKDTLLKRHKFLKERMIALYMYIMPKRMGFQFLHWIIRR